MEDCSFFQANRSDKMKVLKAGKAQSVVVVIVTMPVMVVDVGANVGGQNVSDA